MCSSGKTLVFTVALNGYQWLFKENIAHQRAYARQHGYDFVAVTRPSFSRLGLECAWLKLSLLANALRRYDTVMYVDVDAAIKPSAPPLDSILEGDKYLYMAHGYSGRFNSGVIIARKSEDLHSGILGMIDSCEVPPPVEDSVGWGENGHVISYAKTKAFVKILPKQWNNNSDVDLDDFIRHYSMGPLRPLYKARTINKVLYHVARIYVAIARRLLNLTFQPNLRSSLSCLTQDAVNLYPVFNPL